MLPLRRALAASRMLSSDVSAGFDPAYAERVRGEEQRRTWAAAWCSTSTRARAARAGSNDARAEYMARIRKIMDDARRAVPDLRAGQGRRRRRRDHRLHPRQVRHGRHRLRRGGAVHAQPRGRSPAKPTSTRPNAATRRSCAHNKQGCESEDRSRTQPRKTVDKQQEAPRLQVAALLYSLACHKLHTHPARPSPSGTLKQPAGYDASFQQRRHTRTATRLHRQATRRSPKRMRHRLELEALQALEHLVLAGQEVPRIEDLVKRLLGQLGLGIGSPGARDTWGRPPRSGCPPTRPWRCAAR